MLVCIHTSLPTKTACLIYLCSFSVILLCMCCISYTASTLHSRGVARTVLVPASMRSHMRTLILMHMDEVHACMVADLISWCCMATGSRRSSCCASLCSTRRARRRGRRRSTTRCCSSTWPSAWPMSLMRRPQPPRSLPGGLSLLQQCFDHAACPLVCSFRMSSIYITIVM